MSSPGRLLLLLVQLRCHFPRKSPLSLMKDVTKVGEPARSSGGYNSTGVLKLMTRGKSPCVCIPVPSWWQSLRSSVLGSGFPLGGFAPEGNVWR